MSTPSTDKPNSPPTDLKSNLRAAFIKGLIAPLLVLAFFLCAPHWLNRKVHSQIEAGIQKSSRLTATEKTQRLAEFEKINFAAVAFDSPRDLAPLRANLEKAGVVADFHYLRWSLWLSLALNAILLGVTGATVLLNRFARQSPEALIRYYRISWRFGMVAALAQVFLLAPLLTYGAFEATVLAANRYYPQLLIGLMLCGLIALWKTTSILLKNVPPEFTEPMSRTVTPDEAPELWQAVRRAAELLKTTPPDHIIIGMQMNFYVTELAVKHASGRAEGRTLFLSQPLLKQLSVDEVIAIIGHELGHFIGDDTRLTREFYPLRFKIHATMMTLAHAGPAGWTSLQSLSFFRWCFGATEQEFSRQRELLADRKAAELTSPATTARALVKFHVVDEAFQLGFAEALRSQAGNPFDLPLHSLIREKLVTRAEFWSELFERKSPHPLDSHPALHLRLEALAQNIGPDAAKEMATAETESAFAQWFTGRDSLFAAINQEAEAAVSTLRTRVQIVEADRTSETGRQLLDTHFPECRIRVSGLIFWLVFLLTALVAAGSLAATIFVHEPFIQALSAVIGLLAGAFAAVIWARHRDAELVLTAEGIAYAGWLRPLHFADVQSVSFHNNNGSVTATFALKTKHPPFWKFALLRFQRRSVSLPLSWFKGNQRALAQTIFRYLTRQLEE